MSVAGLVLAAGAGRRFGQPKATVEVAGRRLVDRAVGTLRAGGCDPVYVVSGAVDLDVANARVVPNSDWPSGLGSSLRAGLAASEDDAVVISLVDQPGIGTEVVRRLLAVWRDGASVAVATYDGYPRNPVLIAREHWPEVSRLAVGEVGARPFLAARPDLVWLVECGDVADPADIDVRADLTGIRIANGGDRDA